MDSNMVLSFYSFYFKPNFFQSSLALPRVFLIPTPSVVCVTSHCLLSKAIPALVKTVLKLCCDCVMNIGFWPSCIHHLHENSSN